MAAKAKGHQGQKEENLAAKPEFFKTFLTQNVVTFVGNGCRTGGVAFTESDFGQAVLQHMAHFAGEKSVGVIITEITAAGKTAIKHAVPNVGLQEVLMEGLDEFLDGTRETWLKKNGKITGQDVHTAGAQAAANTAKQIREIKNLAQAVARLNPVEAEAFLGKVVAFCANEAQAKKFKVWRAKLTDVGVVRTLASCSVADWADRLVALYGDVQPSKVSMAWAWTGDRAAKVWTAMFNTATAQQVQIAAGIGAIMLEAHRAQVRQQRANRRALLRKK